MAKLYRGITLTKEQLRDYSFLDGAGLPPNPGFDEKGRKTVGDGNEYGIYMTTNKNMANDVYGRADVRDAEDDGARINDISTGLPRIGITMEIDTDGINVRHPWMTQSLKAHYNNGYSGDEYISTEPIPQENVRYRKVYVGPDILHREKDFSHVPPEKMKDALTEEMDRRGENLRQMKEDLGTLPGKTLKKLSNSYVNYDWFTDSLRLMYGDRGAVRQDIRAMKLSSPDDMQAFLLARSYRENGLDFEAVKDISMSMAGMDPNCPVDLNYMIAEAESEGNVSLADDIRANANYKKQMNDFTSAVDGIEPGEPDRNLKDKTPHDKSTGAAGITRDEEPQLSVTGITRDEEPQFSVTGITRDEEPRPSVWETGIMRDEEPEVTGIMRDEEPEVTGIMRDEGSFTQAVNGIKPDDAPKL